MASMPRVIFRDHAILKPNYTYPPRRNILNNHFDVKERRRSFAFRSELQGPNPIVATGAKLPLVHLASKSNTLTKNEITGCNQDGVRQFRVGVRDPDTPSI